MSGPTLLAVLVLVGATALPALGTTGDEPASSTTTGGYVEEVTTFKDLSTGVVITNTEVREVDDGPIIVSFSENLVAAGNQFAKERLAVAAASTTMCYEGGKSFTHNINAGKITAQYSVRWCGRDGRITSVSNLWCQGTASGAREYNGCAINGTGVGTTKYSITGTWNFRIWAPPVPFPISQPLRLSATHHPNGAYTGTWCLNC